MSANLFRLFGADNGRIGVRKGRSPGSSNLPPFRFFFLARTSLVLFGLVVRVGVRVGSRHEDW